MPVNDVGWRVPEEELTWLMPFFMRHRKGAAKLKYATHMEVRRYRPFPRAKVSRTFFAVYSGGRADVMSYATAMTGRGLGSRVVVMRALRAAVSAQCCQHSVRSGTTSARRSARAS